MGHRAWWAHCLTHGAQEEAGKAAVPTRPNDEQLCVARGVDEDMSGLSFTNELHDLLKARFLGLAHRSPGDAFGLLFERTPSRTAPRAGRIRMLRRRRSGRARP